MTVSQTTTSPSKRKRRVHQKSRHGCRNCKLRRVKCDETRPQCTKCVTFGVSCNYDDPTAPDLQTSFTGAAMGTIIGTNTIKVPSKPTRSTNLALYVSRVEIPPYLSPGISCISDDGTSTQLDWDCIGRLDRFNKRTILSIGTPRAAAMFQGVLTELACFHPCLMHVVQAVTAMHDRHLSAAPSPRQTSTELHHISRGAALFNAKLSAPVQARDRDALWATAALLGVAAMSWIEASCADEAWPLTPRAPTDLDWLRVSASKSVVWELTDPMRADGPFHGLADDFVDSLVRAGDAAGIEGIPMEFRSLCEVDERTTEMNPYLAVLQELVPLLAAETTQANVLTFLSFLGHMSADFKRLLQVRDPRALLLLAYWYAKVRDLVWWLERRAVLECQAICLYLERHHAEETAILNLLPYPKIRCGLVGIGYV